jgi:hypothetical protein
VRIAVDLQVDSRGYVIVGMMTGCCISNFVRLLFVSRRPSFTLYAVLGLKSGVTCLIPFMSVRNRETILGNNWDCNLYFYCLYIRLKVIVR